MKKMNAVLVIFILFFSVGFAASMLSSTNASAQCTWMDGLSMVRGFDNVHIHDYRWQRVGPTCCAAAETCSVGAQGVPLCAQAVSPAKVVDPAPRPDVRPGGNKAIQSDTCPSAYDIDCFAAPSCSPGGCALGPG
ncbi:MAG: hypothetical protein ACP5SH_00710 [Syntrophobacteraceae bacterium]